MKVLGIICEYNPLHNGHKYHLEQSIKKTNADFTVCILSGNFVQRGEPAIINKWARAKMSVIEGIDLVIELPIIYSISSAELFSYGALKYLDQLGFITDVIFGSEIGDIKKLKEVSSHLTFESKAFRDELAKELSNGYSFPEARAKTLSKLTSIDSSLLSSSNNVLGIEYLKAANRIDTNMRLDTIKRKDSDYKSKEIQGTYTSATSIRNLIYNNEDYSKYVPHSSYKIIKDHIINGTYTFFENYSDLILYSLKSKRLDEILKYDYMNDGLGQRFLKGLKESKDIDELISYVKTRRHTATRIKRALINLLLNIKKDEKYSLSSHNSSIYYNVLGFSSKASTLLKMVKEKEKYPIISKTANYYSLLNDKSKKLFEMGLKSTQIYALGYQNQNKRISASDYYSSPFILQ